MAASQRSIQLGPKYPTFQISTMQRAADYRPLIGRARVLQYLAAVLAVMALFLLAYGLVRTYSTQRYLRGFADAIIPLNGSAEEKTEALLAWFRHMPSRSDINVQGASDLRDPVNIVQNERLLRVCGSASNAFLNLADSAGLSTRRLLLLGPAGGTMHVVVEVKWDDLWVVVDPQHAVVFTDRTGSPLTKDELRNPVVFRDAISRIPGYSPSYTFERTAHLHLLRIPLVGGVLLRFLNRINPGWDEALDWSYIMENSSLWPILLSLLLFLVAGLLNWTGRRNRKPQPETRTAALQEVASA